MKKRTPLFVLSCALFLFWTCNTNKKITNKTLEPASVQLVAIFTGCSDSLGLYEFDGIGFKSLEQINAHRRDTFRFNVSSGKPRFYYVGTKEARKRPVILGSEEHVIVSGKCKNMRQAGFSNSSLNRAYDELLQSFNKSNANMRQASRSFQKSGNNAEKRQTAITEMAKIDQQKTDLLDTLKSNNPYIAKIAALNTYLSFQNHNQSRFKHEIEYFAKAYFEHADLSDPDYNHIPYVFEAFKNWSKVLSQQRIPETVLKSFIDSTLQDIPSASKTMKYALGGIVTSFQSGNHPLFEEYGNRYVSLFENQNNPNIQQLKKKLDLAESFAKGAVAPDFTQNTPEGEPMSLSDLRGKVVLVDFWASWCGPCRKENPNVIKVYNKYKEKGFDVLGVSLDRKKDPWVKAIKKDQLPWHHISDLRGWKNEVAQLYSVSSIPHTVLLDQEGRIIARNLRGHQLEETLSKLFGE